MLITGITVDFARVFQGSIALQSAVRNAAEAAATQSTSSSEALATARRIVCTETAGMPGSAGTPPSCSSPTVGVPSFSRSTTAPGASARYPIATAQVSATMPFRMLFSYPLMAPGGEWTLDAAATFQIIQGR